MSERNQISLGRPVYPLIRDEGVVCSNPITPTINSKYISIDYEVVGISDKIKTSRGRQVGSRLPNRLQNPQPPAIIATSCNLGDGLLYMLVGYRLPPRSPSVHGGAA